MNLNPAVVSNLPFDAPAVPAADETADEAASYLRLFGKWDKKDFHCAAP